MSAVEIRFVLLDLSDQDFHGLLVTSGANPHHSASPAGGLKNNPDLSLDFKKIFSHSTLK